MRRTCFPRRVSLSRRRLSDQSTWSNRARAMRVFLSVGWGAPGRGAPGVGWLSGRCGRGRVGVGLVVGVGAVVEGAGVCGDAGAGVVGAGVDAAHGHDGGGHYTHPPWMVSSCSSAIVSAWAGSVVLVIRPWSWQ